MNKDQLLVQDIANEFRSIKGCSVSTFYPNVILIGFQGRNFAFKVLGDTFTKDYWNGETTAVKSFNEAYNIVLLDCLPF